MLRHASVVGADLPPDESVVLDAPDEPMRSALEAARAGEHAPAAALLAATRLGSQWERRSVLVSRFATAALDSHGWLDSWLAEEPDDPDAALVTAELRIHQAWEIRTAQRAADVTEDRFQAFFTLLEDAMPALGRAVELNPADPVPWEVALTHARGSQAPREVFDTYWSEAVARAPHHVGCHITALQYLCAKWYGSDEEMFSFAERAAEDALPGSELHALPLYAAVEYDIVADATEPGPVTDPRIVAAIDRALELSTWHEPGAPEAARFRNHLALMLVRSDRTPEALEVFRSIGPYATTYPWAYLSDDPRQEFLDLRTGVRMDVASRTPFFGRPPRPTGPAAPSPQAPRSLAIALAPPSEVAQAVLMCGVSLRLAPAAVPGSTQPPATWVEAAPDQDPPAGGLRATLQGGDSLAAAANTFTTGEKWPAVVLRRSGDRYGFALFRRGKELASHTWDRSAPVTELAEAAATAAVLAKTFGISDPRPLTHLLRASDSPSGRLSGLLAALGLPPLPEDFGARDSVLAELSGTQLVTRRGLLGGFKDTLIEQGSPDVTRSKSWWAVRIMALTLFAPLTVYAWWAPHIGVTRSVLATVATLYVAGQLGGARRALRRRRRRS